MKTSSIFLSLSVIFLIILAGCVAPPKETPGTTSSSGSVSVGTETDAAPVTTGTPVNVYVTHVTPYSEISAETTQTSGYSAFLHPTPLAEDRSCRIYSSTQNFLYNATAFTFNLKNPPMYINYSVIPQNVTEKKAVTERTGSKQEVIYEYSTYDPQSFFIVTVRSKATGEIYLEDGFGTGYTTYLTRTLKVLDSDDMLIEMKGNKITATVNFWVKPVGNFDNSDNMTFDTCTYWGQTRDATALAFVTSATTPEVNTGTVIKR